MRALITGGTGFLGSHIARKWIAAGNTARILRRATSSLRALEGIPPEKLEHAIGDVTDPNALHSAMEGCEIVFHAAAVADYWRADRAKMYAVNVGGSREVFAAAREVGVQRVIFTSSAAAVGSQRGGDLPSEATYFNLDPARFPYGHSKFLAEAEAYRAVEAGLDLVILNPTVIFGPGDLNLISGSSLIELKRGGVPAMPAGGVTVIDVRDAADAHLAAVTKGISGERYILGAYNVSWREIITLSAQVVGVHPPLLTVPAILSEPLGLLVDALRAVRIPIIVDGNQIRLSGQEVYFDCSKSWEVFGRPVIQLQKMLEDTYQWYVTAGLIS